MSIELAIDNHVARVTINRPEVLNAIDPGAERPLPPQLNCSTAKFHTNRASRQCRSPMKTDCSGVGYRRYR